MVEHLVVQAVSSTGQPLSAPLSASPATGGHVHLAATPGGALVVWDMQNGGPVQAVPLRCVAGG
jgi:hypothetical protein